VNVPGGESRTGHIPPSGEAGVFEVRGTPREEKSPCKHRSPHSVAGAHPTAISGRDTKRMGGDFFWEEKKTCGSWGTFLDKGSDDAAYS